MINAIARPVGPIDEWDAAIHAFLIEKHSRSGSRRTVESYYRMLSRFFGDLGTKPDQVKAPDVFAYAHGIGPSGRDPSPTTVNATRSALPAGPLAPGWGYGVASRVCRPRPIAHAA